MIGTRNPTHLYSPSTITPRFQRHRSRGVASRPSIFPSLSWQLVLPGSPSDARNVLWEMCASDTVRDPHTP